MHFNCDICGKFGDEGAFFTINGVSRRICLDCDESLSNEQIEQYFLGEDGGCGGRASHDKTQIPPQRSEMGEVVIMDMRKSVAEFLLQHFAFSAQALTTTQPRLSMIAERSEHKELTIAECNGIVIEMRVSFL